MANISDKTNLTQHGEILPTVDWISQINAGGKIYDIATHHSVTFVEGNNGAKTVWNGLTDLEVIIPSIADIVQTPIEFAGTVDADGKITWVNGHSEAEAGSLVFITENCTFDEKPCEKGDMAIYDGSKWYTVSGEHQIDILGTADDNKVTVAVGSAKDVLIVEGKTLTLALDYADLNKHVSLDKGEVTSVVFDQSCAVDSIDIKLNQGAAKPTTIGKEQTINNATKLADGTVTLTNAAGLVNGITWGTFTPGTATTSSKNTDMTLGVSGGALSLAAKQTSGAFVDTVSMNPVTFTPATSGEEGSISMLTGITPGKGSKFFNGIHETVEGETADLTIKGFVKPTKDNVQFVEAWTDSTLAPVTSITKGEIKFDANGTDFATGFGTEASSGDVVSSVTVTYKNDTSVLDSAKVENHVLSFGSTNVTSNVSYGCGYKSLTKGGYAYTAPVATNTPFVTSGFTTVADKDYTFGRLEETVYTPSSASYKLNTPSLDVTYGSYTFNDDGMKAAVPTGTFVTSVTPGELPSLTDSTFSTTTVTGTVGTALTATEIKFNVLNSTSIDMPGAYSLETVEKGGDITVGNAGALKTLKGTVNLSGYVTDVTIE